MAKTRMRINGTDATRVYEIGGVSGNRASVHSKNAASMRTALTLSGSIRHNEADRKAHAVHGWKNGIKQVNKTEVSVEYKIRTKEI